MIKINFNLRFPGQYKDQETGLNYNYFRDYDAGTGRYIESDLIGLAGGVNTYGYVGSDPIIKTDPLGLFPMYGCWGGSNWSGCGSGTEIPANPKPPKDELDACYMQHDYCYDKAQSSLCITNKPTIASCDTKLVQCLTPINYNSIDSLWGKFFGPYSTWWALLHARVSR